MQTLEPDLLTQWLIVDQIHIPGDKHRVNIGHTQSKVQLTRQTGHSQDHLTYLWQI